MATADQVRGLKGALTKSEQEREKLLHQLEDANRYADDVLEVKRRLERSLEVAVEQMQRADSAAQAHKARADQLQKDLNEARKSEADACYRLKAAELEQARLNGYIQRVAEDDAAREGNVEVADSRSVPRRPSPPLSYPSNYAGGTFGRPDTDGYSNGARRY